MGLLAQTNPKEELHKKIKILVDSIYKEFTEEEPSEDFTYNDFARAFDENDDVMRHMMTRLFHELRRRFAANNGYVDATDSLERERRWDYDHSFEGSYSNVRRRTLRDRGLPWRGFSRLSRSDRGMAGPHDLDFERLGGIYVDEEDDDVIDGADLDNELPQLLPLPVPLGLETSQLRRTAQLRPTDRMVGRTPARDIEFPTSSVSITNAGAHTENRNISPSMNSNRSTGTSARSPSNNDVPDFATLIVQSRANRAISRTQAMERARARFRSSQARDLQHMRTHAHAHTHLLVHPHTRALARPRTSQRISSRTRQYRPDTMTDTDRSDTATNTNISPTRTRTTSLSTGPLNTPSNNVVPAQRDSDAYIPSAQSNIVTARQHERRPHWDGVTHGFSEPNPAPDQNTDTNIDMSANTNTNANANTTDRDILGLNVDPTYLPRITPASLPPNEQVETHARTDPTPPSAESTYTQVHENAPTLATNYLTPEATVASVSTTGIQDNTNINATATSSSSFSGTGTLDTREYVTVSDDGMVTGIPLTTYDLSNMDVRELRLLSSIQRGSQSRERSLNNRITFGRRMDRERDIGRYRGRAGRVRVGSAPGGEELRTLPYMRRSEDQRSTNTDPNPNPNPGIQTDGQSSTPASTRIPSTYIPATTDILASTTTHTPSSTYTQAEAHSRVHSRTSEMHTSVERADNANTSESLESTSPRVARGRVLNDRRRREDNTRQLRQRIAARFEERRRPSFPIRERERDGDREIPSSRLDMTTMMRRSRQNVRHISSYSENPPSVLPSRAHVHLPPPPPLVPISFARMDDVGINDAHALNSESVDEAENMDAPR
eukprot:CFRG2623T1